jgi:hypothetical protein
MSAIASFYLLPKHKSSGLIAAAEAQKQAMTKKKWGLFKPKLPLNPDPFWSFLSTQAKELAEFPYSGYLLLDVEMLVEGALSGDSPDDLGSKLSKITDSSFVAYSVESARQTIKLLENTNLSDAQIKEFLDGEDRGEEYHSLVKPLQNAINCLKVWLGSVTDEAVGVLNIG